VEETPEGHRIRVMAGGVEGVQRGEVEEEHLVVVEGVVHCCSFHSGPRSLGACSSGVVLRIVVYLVGPSWIVGVVLRSLEVAVAFAAFRGEHCGPLLELLVYAQLRLRGGHPCRLSCRHIGR